MIPDSSQELQEPSKPSKIPAHILHTMLLEVLSKDPRYRDVKSKEQINKLLIDYTYRGSNIGYVSENVWLENV